MRKYYVVPAAKARMWDDIFDFMWDNHGVDGNDMMGCRTFLASTGSLVMKLDIWED